ncbi:MAG: hypothetical protein QOH99_276 [Frankiaceae bacterium]|jgi:hypothetical protein|nr:hypothetical protein [Frankiaceae bacterium]
MARLKQRLPTACEPEVTAGRTMGGMGLVVTIVLVIACYFLFRSFLTHLKRVPASFDKEPEVKAPDGITRQDQ